MSHEALADLHTAIVDARHGYETAVDKAENPALVSLFRELHGLHGNAHSDVHTALTAKGIRPDDDGSFVGTIEKTMISLRSAFLGVDTGSLGSFASVEESVLGKYDEAISEERDASIAAMLRGHRERLAAKIAEMKRLAA